MKFTLLLLILGAMSFAADRNYFVYFGTYTDSGSKGIYVFRFDESNGAITPVGLVAETENPSYLVVDPEQRFLYATNEVETFEGKSDGSISVYAIDRRSGKLSLLQRVSSGGWGPVYLSFDRTGKYLFVANYGAGSVAVFPVAADGRLGARTSLVRHEGTKENPARPHSMRVTNDNRFVLVPDLALEQLFIYAFDEKTGALSKTCVGSANVEKGSGPRHLAIGQSGKFVYMGNENSSKVSVFELSSSGELREVQSLSTLPSGFKGENTTAEVLLDRAGKHLYVSNRGEDSIALFDVGSDGKLSFVERVATGGKMPRGFALDPSGMWLFAANQASNNAVVFKVDPKSGRLTTTGTSFDLISPVSVAFVSVSR
jgi:6-phosphogluconolactonase